jgi:glyoxylase-like metal-dependent hydrolase (beta-lactamase superfamily II)
MQIQSFVFNPFYENTYVLFDDSKEAIIVDPGCYERHEKDQLTQFIEQNQLKPKLVVNTHCHIDHVLGNEFVKSQYNIPLWIPEGEKEVLASVVAYAPTWGIAQYQPAEVDKYLSSSDHIDFGNTSLNILFAPGHAPGHMMFFHEQEKQLIAGDVIFRDSIGRTDLPGGNHEQLLESVRKTVYTLPKDTTIYAGHGPTTTVEHEMNYNPFVRA